MRTLRTGSAIPGIAAETETQGARVPVMGAESVVVSVPAASGAITKGQPIYLDGFLGFALFDLENDDSDAQDLTISIARGIYEVEDAYLDTGGSMAKGDDLYWDSGASKFTETEGEIYAGVVYEAADSNDVARIYFDYDPDAYHPAQDPFPEIANQADVAQGDLDGEKASVEIGVEGDNTGITLEAHDAGTAGNDITITVVDPATASHALAVAVVDTDITVTLATDAGTAASGTTGVEGSNNGLTYTADAVGTDGNDIWVVLEDPDDNDQSLSVDVEGNVILVHLATGGGGAITSTGAEVLAAINGDGDASALVTVTHTGASTGAAAVTDETVNLSGGVEPAEDSTAAKVIDAINDDADAVALVTASDTGDSTGAGAMPAVGEASLADGVDPQAETNRQAINALYAAMEAVGLMASS